MIRNSRGFVGFILLLGVISIVVGGYFLYKTNSEVRSWISQNLHINSNEEESFVNPFSLARDQERRESVKAISDAIFQYVSEKKGVLPTSFPKEETCIGSKPPCYDLASLLVPVFIDKIPKDPQNGSDENTLFRTFRNSDGRIVVKIKGELGGEFEVVR